MPLPELEGLVFLTLVQHITLYLVLKPIVVKIDDSVFTFLWVTSYENIINLPINSSIKLKFPIFVVINVGTL